MSLFDNWLVQTILGNLAWIALAALGGGLMAYVRYISPEWASVALYGLAGAALCLFIWSALRAPRSETPVTIENVESRTLEWCRYFGLSNQSVTPVSDPNMAFQLVVTTKSGRKVVIFRPVAGTSRMLNFQSSLTLANEHKAIFDALTPDSKEAFLEELSLEMARSKIGVNIDGSTLATTILATLPIRPTLDATEFVRAIDEVDGGIVLARSVIVIGLRKHRTQPVGEVRP